ncbi:MAG: restriction endonuclease [Desulfobaccales bacterium]
MPADSNTSLANWQKFEKHVEAILSLAGYEVDHDSLMAGGQSDLVATKSVGPIISRILVECKFSDKNKSVGVDIIENFASRVMMLRTNDMVDAGLLVTNTSFTRFAKAVPQRAYLKLLTIDKLYSMIFDFRSYLSNIITEFEQSRLFKTFVRPLMDEFNFEERTPSQEIFLDRKKETDDNIIDMIDFCDAWQNSKDGKRLCLLGDYGTGKTSFCRWYQAHRARKCLANIDYEPVPLLIPLHRFTKAVDIEALVTDFLVNQCKIGNFQLEAFQFLLEQGRFLIILDGFDEMARQVDREVRYQTVSELSKLAKGSAKIILTGRPSYFPTDEELVEALGGSEQSDLYIAARNAYNELVDFELFKIRPFSRKQIRTFVKKSVDDVKQSEKILKFIERRYDLLDLVSRPVLLEMVIKSLPRLLSIDNQNTINTAKLYEVYTSLWVDREHKKGEFRKLISKDDKLHFMEELAFQFFLEGKPFISHRKLGDPILNFFNIGNTELDHFSHDIRTCSFLHRIPYKGYTFVHRSFQEFFVAKKLITAIKLEQSSPWNEHYLPTEIVRFCAELIAEEGPEISKQLSDWANQNDGTILHKNCLTVALLVGTEINTEILTNYQMDLDILRSYVTFKFGDDQGNTKFMEYLYNIILKWINNISHMFRDLASADPVFIQFESVDQADILSDVFFQAYTLLQQEPIKKSSEINSFLTKLITNSWHGLAKDRIERMKKEIGIEDFIGEWKSQGYEIDFDSILTTRQTPEDKASLSQIFDICMEALNEKDRLFFKYYYIDELSSREISQNTGLNVSNINVMMHRINARLRRNASLKSKLLDFLNV